MLNGAVHETLDRFVNRGDINSTVLNANIIYLFGQRHAKRDLQTYPKSVDPDQLPRLRRRVWSGSALFDNHNINGTYFSCYVDNFIIYMCFHHRIGADLGLHYVKCPKVPFRVTLVKYNILMDLINMSTMISRRYNSICRKFVLQSCAILN